jgi:hypothetical protein
MAYSGQFKPRNPQKYMGDPTNIIYRSSWECKVMSWLDNNRDVISWSSEEVIIPYKSPVDGRFHRYFPDFLVKVKTKDDKINTILIEVKPKRQTLPPVPKKRVTKQFINEVATYGVNQAKWKAAQEYCLDRKWDFKIITEDDLGL